MKEPGGRVPTGLLIALGVQIAAALALVSCAGEKATPTAPGTQPAASQRYRIEIIADGREAGTIGSRDIEGLPHGSISGAAPRHGPALLSVVQLARVEQFKSLVVTGRTRDRKELHAVGLTRQEVNDSVLLSLNAFGTADLVRQGVPQEQWVFDVARVDVEGAVPKEGPPYRISVLLKGNVVATLGIADMEPLEQRGFGDNKGPTLLSVLRKAGVQEFGRVAISGEALGRTGPNRVVLSRAQVTDTVILDFTRRGTVKLASPDIPNNQWVLDVAQIEVDGQDSAGPGPGTGGGSGAGGGGGGTGGGGGGQR